MKVSQIKKLIEGKADDEIIIGLLFEKWDADYVIEELNSGITEEDDLTPEFTDKEWARIEDLMLHDKRVWQAADEAFDECIERVIEERKGQNVN